MSDLDLDPLPVDDDPILRALSRAEALAAVGRHDAAEQELRKALALAPDDPQLQVELARSLLVQERPKEALALADRAIARAPEDCLAHAVRALALIDDLRRRREAVDAAHRAVALAPEEPYPYLVYARVLGRAGWHRESLEAARRAVTLDPRWAAAHDAVGHALLGLDRHAEAEAAFREALRLNPHDSGTINDLGVALQAQDRRDEARELFETSARADPGDRIARQNLAADARSFVNGRWGWAGVVFASVMAIGSAADGDGSASGFAAAGSWVLVALAVAAFLLVRGRRRRAALSPAAQRLLADQRWWERSQLHRWRPFWYLIPAPIWFVLLIPIAIGGVSSAADEGWDPLSLAILGVIVVALLLTGRRTWTAYVLPRWQRRGR